MNCPFCGHAMEGPDLLLVKELSTILYEEQEFRLCPQEWSIMELLVKHAPHVVPYDRLLFALYPMDDEPERGVDVLKLKLYYLRKKFIDIPLWVITVWGQGARLIFPGKIRLVLDMVKTYEEPEDEVVPLLQRRRVHA